MTTRQSLFEDRPLQRGAVSLEMAATRNRACGLCKLDAGCVTPRMPLHGQGRLKLLVIGESPGEKEDQQGRPFVGKSGELLRAKLDRVGVSLDNDCWATNSLACRPAGNKITSKDSVLHCRPGVLKAIHELRPNAILLLGGTAVQSVIGWLWREDPGGASAWAGWQIPSRRLNAWVLPSYHPSYVLRQGGGKGRDCPVEALLARHISEAVRLAKGGRPYGDAGPEDLEKRVTCVTDHVAAAVKIRELINRGVPTAFDYETTSLKPHSSESRIVCCAVSDGEVSYAYPWHGDAIKATSELLLSDVPKIGYNCSFEENWTWCKLGHGVNNWVFDGMLGAHIKDNRPGTKSLKFQAFVGLGADSYDDHIKPYLKAKSGNLQNQIHRLNLGLLLRYCGADALYERLLADRLAKDIGVTLG